MVVIGWEQIAKREQRSDEGVAQSLGRGESLSRVVEEAAVDEVDQVRVLHAQQVLEVVVPQV